MAFGTEAGHGARASSAVKTLSHFASATSSGVTITVPAGVDNTDIAILWDCVGYSTPVTTVPSGWTLLAAGICSGRGNLIISYKILSSSDASSSVTGANGSSVEAKRMDVFRLSAPIVGATPSTFNEQETTGNPSPQTVSAAAATAPLIVIGGTLNDGSAGGSSLSSDVGFDNIYQVQYGGGDWMGAGYKIHNGAGADHSVDMNDDGTNYLTSGYIEVA